MSMLRAKTQLLKSKENLEAKILDMQNEVDQIDKALVALSDEPLAVSKKVAV